MDCESFDLYNKHLLGEELSEEEKKFLAGRNLKYQLVRHLYLEKVNSDFEKSGDEKRMTNFHFSPGEDFYSSKVTVIDVVNSLLETNRKIQSSELECAR